MDPPVYQLSVYVHLLAAIAWVGGMLFLALVVVPATREMAGPERARLFDAVGRRFRAVGWVCIALLLATGLVNLQQRGVSLASATSGELLRSPFGQVLGLKLLLVAAMLSLSAVHDFGLGPAATRALLDPSAAVRGARLRRRAALVARVNGLLGLAVVFLAIALVRGLPG
jgi:putative copper resistance protein D